MCHSQSKMFCTYWNCEVLAGSIKHINCLQLILRLHDDQILYLKWSFKLPISLYKWNVWRMWQSKPNCHIMSVDDCLRFNNSLIQRQLVAFHLPFQMCRIHCLPHSIIHFFMFLSMGLHISSSWLHQEKGTCGAACFSFLCIRWLSNIEKQGRTQMNTQRVYARGRNGDGRGGEEEEGQR